MVSSKLQDRLKAFEKNTEASRNNRHPSHASAALNGSSRRTFAGAGHNGNSSSSSSVRDLASTFQGGEGGSTVNQSNHKHNDTADLGNHLQSLSVSKQDAPTRSPSSNGDGNGGSNSKKVSKWPTVATPTSPSRTSPRQAAKAFVSPASVSLPLTTPESANRPLWKRPGGSRVPATEATTTTTTTTSNTKLAEADDSTSRFEEEDASMNFDDLCGTSLSNFPPVHDSQKGNNNSDNSNSNNSGSVNQSQNSKTKGEEETGQGQQERFTPAATGSVFANSKNAYHDSIEVREQQRPGLLKSPFGETVKLNNSTSGSRGGRLGASMPNLGSLIKEDDNRNNSSSNSSSSSLRPPWTATRRTLNRSQAGMGSRTIFNNVVKEDEEYVEPESLPQHPTTEEIDHQQQSNKPNHEDDVSQSCNSWSSSQWLNNNEPATNATEDHPDHFQLMQQETSSSNLCYTGDLSFTSFDEQVRIARKREMERRRSEANLRVAGGPSLKDRMKAFKG